MRIHAGAAETECGMNVHVRPHTCAVMHLAVLMRQVAVASGHMVSYVCD